MSLRILNTPHPFIFNLGSILLPGLLAFVVIFFLAPFNFDDMSARSRLWQALGSSLIVSGSILGVVYSLKYIVPEWMRPSRWTLGKEILLFIVVLFVIALIHFFTFVGIHDLEASLLLFQKMVVRTLMISIFPIVGLVLFEQYNHRTQQLKRVMRLNKEIRNFRNERNPIPVSEAQKVWFAHENGKAACQLDLHSIQYLKSEGNYLDIFYLTESRSPGKKLVRNSLRSAEELLPDTNFWRVHRSYLVNLQHVESVSGNARDLVLEMKISGTKIPVSRAKAKLLSEKIGV